VIMTTDVPHADVCEDNSFAFDRQGCAADRADMTLMWILHFIHFSRISADHNLEDCKWGNRPDVEIYRRKGAKRCNCGRNKKQAEPICGICLVRMAKQNIVLRATGTERVFVCNRKLFKRGILQRI
jgi:hypothetical protein